MKFKILTIFPEMVKNVLSESILGRAQKSGAIKAEVIDIRPFSLNKHKNTDDAPFGGGAGMVMLTQPAIDAIKFAMGKDFRGKRIYLSPKGERFTQRTAERLSREEELILLAGHYEGIDQRVIDGFIDEEISVGDYVLTGGELGSLIIVDAVSRLLPGVLGRDESSKDESFSMGLMEYPQYTRPREYLGMSVPNVLLGGDQKLIDRWRRDEAVRITYERRSEMLLSAPLDKYDRALVRKLKQNGAPKVKIITSNPEKARRVMARLYEACGGAIAFADDDDGSIDCAVFLDVSSEPDFYCKRVFLSRPPKPCELEAAKNAGAELFGVSPLLFDPFITELKGDEGIKQLVFSGVTEDDFLSLSSAILPVKKIKGDIIQFPKSRRAIRINGSNPSCKAEFEDGSIQAHSLTDESEAYIKAIAEYCKSGKTPF